MTHYWNHCTWCFHFSPKCTKIVGVWGSAPDPAGGAYIPLMKSMTLHKIIAPDASNSVQNAAKSLVAEAPAQTPLGELTYIIDEIHDTLLRIIASDASIYVQNAPKSLAAGALPQTPLGELTALPRPPSVKGWDGDLVTILVGVDFDMCPLACDQCPWLFWGWLWAWLCSWTTAFCFHITNC